LDLFFVLLQVDGTHSNVRFDIAVYLKNSPLFVTEAMIITGLPYVPEGDEEGYHLFISGLVMYEVR
jgi:ethanolamine transporter EutH